MYILLLLGALVNPKTDVYGPEMHGDTLFMIAWSDTVMVTEVQPKNLKGWTQITFSISPTSIELRDKLGVSTLIKGDNNIDAPIIEYTKTEPTSEWYSFPLFLKGNIVWCKSLHNSSYVITHYTQGKMQCHNIVGKKNTAITPILIGE